MSIVVGLSFGQFPLNKHLGLHGLNSETPEIFLQAIEVNKDPAAQFLAMDPTCLYIVPQFLDRYPEVTRGLGKIHFRRLPGRSGGGLDPHRGAAPPHALALLVCSVILSSECPPNPPEMRPKKQ